MSLLRPVRSFFACSDCAAWVMTGGHQPQDGGATTTRIAAHLGDESAFVQIGESDPRHLAYPCACCGAPGPGWRVPAYLTGVAA